MYRKYASMCRKDVRTPRTRRAVIITRSYVSPALTFLRCLDYVTKTNQLRQMSPRNKVDERAWDGVAKHRVDYAERGKYEGTRRHHYARHMARGR
jgi:hypothetical protein